MYRRVLEGRSYPEIAAEFDSSLNAIYRVFGARRDRPVVRRRSAFRLSLESARRSAGDIRGACRCGRWPAGWAGHRRQ